MAEEDQFRESIPNHEERQDSAQLDCARAGTVTSTFCAYNQTAQRFISNHVEVAAALPPSTLEDRLSNLVPNSETAIWIVPIRELPPTMFRFPVDLLYLSEEYSVLEAVYSFPIGRVSPSSAMAASILALPAHTVLLSGIETGDRLMLCSPEEMEQRLLQAYSPAIALEPQLICDHAFAIEDYVNTGFETIPSFSDRTRSSSASFEQQGEAPGHSWSSATISVPESSKPEERENTPDPVPPPSRRRKTLSKKSWWQKLFPDEPEEDDRLAPRLALPGLVAYFFTGGAPIAHRVHNISTAGVYVLTSERWYKGTVVRITLTDEREPTAERSITLHGMVARSTDDGVALQFIPEEERARSRGKASTIDHLPGGSSVRQIEQFISHFKSSP